MQTREQLRNEYGELVRRFVKDVTEMAEEGMAIEGIPAPHIPVVGKNYDTCAYKMAFIGMETQETNKSRNCRTFAEDPEKAMSKYEKWLDKSGMFKYREVSAYWLFIKHFLEAFYHTKLQKDEDGSYPAIMSSFVWGNTNSIERYEVTAEENGVAEDVWKKVKKASKRFDQFSHIIHATKPTMAIITYKQLNKEKYLFRGNEIIEHEKVTDQKDNRIEYDYYCLFNREATHKTHVFVTHHPTYIRAYSGIKESDYIQALIAAIVQRTIWPQLPEGIENWNIKE